MTGGFQATAGEPATLSEVKKLRLPVRTAGWMITAVFLALGSAGCADDGRDLRATQPWQTTTTRRPPPTSAPDQQPSRSGMALTSPDFTPGGTLPESATCAGGSTFPAMTWSGEPPLAIELVLTLSDQTDPAQPTLLWLLAGIEPELGGLEAGVFPLGAFETLNGFDNAGFGVPCLESFASGPRDLQFRLHVLTQPSGVAPGESGQQAWDRIRNGTAESASLLARIDNP